MKKHTAMMRRQCVITEYTHVMMNQVIDFLRELRLNNNRQWFNANKERYLEAKAFAEQLCEQLIAVITSFDPRAALLTPADCMYRIYRDTRFSADKTPYKTHIGIFINPPYGKKSPTCGYYLHIEPDNCFLCAGTICLPTKTIQAIRQSIYDDIDEYRSIVESPEFTCCYTKLGDNFLKTAPKGFPKDWPYIDYIRPRDFMALQSLTNDFMCRPSLADSLAESLRQAKRFNDFINFTIEQMMLSGQ